MLQAESEAALKAEAIKEAKATKRLIATFTQQMIELSTQQEKEDARSDRVRFYLIPGQSCPK
eukprot:COSAG01_NODE_412_length_17370_cov_26.910196_13_plen_62_part_00